MNICCLNVGSKVRLKFGPACNTPTAISSNFKRTLDPTFKQQTFMNFKVEYIFQNEILSIEKNNPTNNPFNVVLS